MLKWVLWLKFLIVYAWKEKNKGEKWYPGDTISIAIGHGMLDVTPAQVLLMIGTVALRGNKPALHLLKRIEKKDKVRLFACLI